MTLQEAIRSGKRFKRKHKDEWCWVGDFGWLCDRGGIGIRIGASEIIAEDWEVEEAYYPVTEEELATLVGLRDAARQASTPMKYYSQINTLMDTIKARGPVK